MRDVVDALTAIPARGACTDAERRAALWLHDDLRRRRFEPWVETVWVRPQWHWSLIWHGMLGVAVSLASTAVPEIGLGGVLLALSLGLQLAGFPVLTRLFYRRATQVVVVEPVDPGAIALLVTASMDAPRRGLLARRQRSRNAPPHRGASVCATSQSLMPRGSGSTTTSSVARR